MKRVLTKSDDNVEKDTVALSALWEQTEFGVRSAVETTSAMVKPALELSLASGAPLPRDDDSYSEAREREIEESAVAH